MNEKVGILTQPLHDNYGGLLQAYALKETLKALGYVPVIVNRHGVGANPLRRKLSKIKYVLLNRKIRNNQLPTDYQKALISKNTVEFRKKYIPELSELITSRGGMKSLLARNINVYLVGSDQCWRPKYSPCITNYFLDFAERCKNVKRISYAASFGTAEWELTESETEECRRLIKLFDAVSVREDDGVAMVENHLGRNDAIHVLDPTMLLDTADYDVIVKKERAEKSKGNLNVYVLDKTPEKEALIQYAAFNYNLKPFEVMPSLRPQQEKVNDSNVELFQYPCPSQWLKGIQDAEFVITDSFHGTVFSILYNKPFITLGNRKRGMSRFTSLLRLFGLEHRLVLDLESNNAVELFKQDIEWSTVNNVLERERKKALKFLTDNLEA